ncbi:DUF3253 domain-containing protein [Herbiconiux sp. P18]|uniref:DUF3253 domain-containing protein n=1 Tax=Herbiconiux liangxiaofengii TaxID=3342795 RepID=UPI0035B8DA2E
MAHRQRAGDARSSGGDPAAGSGAAPSGGPGDSKTCASCGRRIEWRAKWARDWNEVRYCSDACRSRGVTAVDRQLEHTILELLAKRAATSTICPSDAARAIGGEEWRDLMEPARRAARRLVDAGDVQITQGGSVVDPSTAKGPIRIRRTRP